MAKTKTTPRKASSKKPKQTKASSKKTKQKKAPPPKPKSTAKEKRKRLEKMFRQHPYDQANYKQIAANLVKKHGGSISAKSGCHILKIAQQHRNYRRDDKVSPHKDTIKKCVGKKKEGYYGYLRKYRKHDARYLVRHRK